VTFEVDTDEGILINTWKLDYIAHEYGHTLQSHKLDLVYLLVIGLPSLIWAGCFDKYREKQLSVNYSYKAVGVFTTNQISRNC
jgi:hypothetical protein